MARELERVLGREKAFDIIRKDSEKLAVENVKRQMAKRKPFKRFEDFVAFLEESDRSPFWSHVLTLTYPEKTPKKLVYRVTECLWAKTFKELNATDLGYLMICHPDFAMAQACHPKIKLERTETLMQGDNYCDHTYYWGRMNNKKER